MQIVIDICESAYKEMCEYGVDRVDYDIQNMIMNGTVLPKHGRLIDADKLREQISNDKREAFSKHQVWLLASVHNKNIPTILKAWGNEE